MALRGLLSGLFVMVGLPVVAQDAPLLALDPDQGLALTAGSLVAYSTAEMAALSSLPGRLKQTLFLLNWKYGMYSTYAVYRKVRSTSLGLNDPSGGGYSFEEITLAPFRWESYANPVSLIVLPLLVVGEGVSRWLGAGSSGSPFTTASTTPGLFQRRADRRSE